MLIKGEITFGKPDLISCKAFNDRGVSSSSWNSRDSQQLLGLQCSPFPWTFLLDGHLGWTASFSSCLEDSSLPAPFQTVSLRTSHLLHLCSQWCKPVPVINPFMLNPDCHPPQDGGYFERYYEYNEA